MTLFTKILLWFLATTVLAIGAFALTTALTFEREDTRQPPFVMIMTLQLREARHAYERGGPEELAHTLRRFRRVTQAEGVLMDAAGRDVCTGRDRSDLLRHRDRRSTQWWWEQDERMVLVRTDEDGRYRYVLEMPRRRWFLWFLHPQHLWVLGLVTLLCYGLAYHLTNPVRALQRAVACFGSGDLTARVRAKRRDELGQLARTFDQMADRLQTLLTAERRLLQDISHELRSPLARLSVAIELARSGDDREYAFGRIQKEADRLNALVGELLQVTRAEGDPAQQRRERVRLDELVRNLAEDGNLEAEARGCEVTLPRVDEVLIEGDPELLRRAVENVMRNAIRHAPVGTAVEARVEKQDHRARVTVRDYGSGVPPEALPRLFDPFYRVENDRNRVSGGVGLGLAIARRALELHHGVIGARNAGPGLLVEMELPIA